MLYLKLDYGVFINMNTTTQLGIYRTSPTDTTRPSGFFVRVNDAKLPYETSTITVISDRTSVTISSSGDHTTYDSEKESPIFNTLVQSIINA